MLHNLYYNLDSPANYAGAKTLYYHARKQNPNITYKKVTDFLESQHTYTVHKQAVTKKFKRNKVKATGLDTHWQADLCDMQGLKKWNNDHCYILTVVDVLSKYGFAESIKDKSAKSVAEAFARIVKRSGRSPWYLMVDKGKEFHGEFRRYVTKDLGITLHISNAKVIKAPNVERFNRILKTRMWKYFTNKRTYRYTNVLQQLVNSCNNRFSNPIQMQPSEVTHRNEEEVGQRLYGDDEQEKKKKKKSKVIKFRYKVGDRVRPIYPAKVFHKGYRTRFSNTVHVITECLPRKPPVYRIREEHTNTPAKGTYYYEELVKAEPLNHY